MNVREEYSEIDIDGTTMYQFDLLCPYSTTFFGSCVASTLTLQRLIRRRCGAASCQCNFLLFFVHNKEDEVRRKNIIE